MKNLLILFVLLCGAQCAQAIYVAKPAPQLHSPLARKEALPFRTSMLSEPPEAGPRFRRTLYRSRGGSQNRQDAGIALIVIGAILGVIGGLWLISVNSKLDQYDSLGKELYPAMAGAVLACGVACLCTGVGLTLIH